jgi:hypothetical protein
MERETTSLASLPTSRSSPHDAPSSLTVPAQVKSISQEEIGKRAYQKWEAAGKPMGKDLKFWLEAQHELSRAKKP